MSQTATTAAKPSIWHRPPKLFLFWLAIFYAVWTMIVATRGLWPDVVAHWPIALSMAFGSYIAGSTPMGGGTVGFPVLVLLFDLPASLGRNFGLAVQSIGMTSATIYILSARRRVDWALLKPSLLGSLIATPLSAAFIAPYAPDLWVKMLFAIIWASFGVLHFMRLKDIMAPEGLRAPAPALDGPIGFFIGALGGVVASITGVGIDMIFYAVLVLFYRGDIKIAIPSSVILMAATSIVGIASNLALGAVNPARYAVDPEVFYNWLAAAPVVALGAPFGAIIVNLLPRAPTLLLVSTLCIGQFLWSLEQSRMSLIGNLAAVAAVAALTGAFLYAFRCGERRRRKLAGDN